MSDLDWKDEPSVTKVFGRRMMLRNASYPDGVEGYWGEHNVTDPDRPGVTIGVAKAWCVGHKRMEPQPTKVAEIPPPEEEPQGAA